MANKNTITFDEYKEFVLIAEGLGLVGRILPVTFDPCHIHFSITIPYLPVGLFMVYRDFNTGKTTLYHRGEIVMEHTSKPEMYYKLTPCYASAGCLPEGDFEDEYYQSIEELRDRVEELVRDTYEEFYYENDEDNFTEDEFDAVIHTVSRANKASELPSAIPLKKFENDLYILSFDIVVFTTPKIGEIRSCTDLSDEMGYTLIQSDDEVAELNKEFNQKYSSYIVMDVNGGRDEVWGSKYYISLLGDKYYCVFGGNWEEYWRINNATLLS